VCPSSFIDRRRVRRIPHTLLRSKALKHGHCRVRTSSIGADRGDDGIWIYGLTGSFIIFTRQIASGLQISVKQTFFLNNDKIASGASSVAAAATRSLHLKTARVITACSSQPIEAG
jgi:hypothetical protein